MQVALNVFSFQSILHRRDLGALIGTDGATVVDDEEKATLFNNYFASVGVVDDNATPVCDMVLNSDNAIDTIEFTTANVQAACS